MRARATPPDECDPVPLISSHPTREDVLALAARYFPAEPGAVMALLNEYGAAPHEPDRERVQLAILTLAAGDLDRLLHFTQVAKTDYRDVLYWAEYPPSA